MSGTRPGLHGQTLISMGLVDLDRLLSGGLPLGSLLLLLEDAHSQQHLNFIKYFVAEGMACRQRVMWLTAQLPGRLAAFLPAEGAPAQSADEGAHKAQEEQPKLKIAWQYEKYIQDEQPSGRAGAGGAAPSSSSSSASTTQRSSKPSSFKRAGAAVEAGISLQWCHTFDLTRPAGEDVLSTGSLECIECRGPGAAALADATSASFLSSHTTTQQPLAAAPAGTPMPALQPAPQPHPQQQHPAGRLVLESLGSSVWGLGDGAEAAVLRLVYNVRQRIQETRCAALVTCPAGLFSGSFGARLEALCDTVLALDPIADDSPAFKLLPDAASASALLSVRKACGIGMLGPRCADAGVYVVRHKRRRLALSPVEVDPDAEARQAAAEAAAGRPGAAKAAASSACGGPAAVGSKALDF